MRNVMLQESQRLLIEVLKDLNGELVNFVNCRVRCTDYAEEIVQNVFLKIRESKSLPRKISNPRAFIFKIAGNLALDALRQEKKRAQILSQNFAVESPLQSTRSEEASFELNEQMRFLMETIEELPPRCQEVLLLSKFEGLTYREIASRLGISIKGVEQHMTLALKRCRSALEQAEC
ncbi:MAG: sigma-70 family RNA polymerase sigma factor [Nitrospina sp.]|nr:sigma-70 family RNA polymerase sigma factor [Nitrospina sp.]